MYHARIRASEGRKKEMCVRAVVQAFLGKKSGVITKGICRLKNKWRGRKHVVGSQKLNIMEKIGRRCYTRCTCYEIIRHDQTWSEKDC